jgi:hypothetical protein
LNKEKIVQELLQLKSHGYTTCINGFKQANGDVLWLLVIIEKIHNNNKYIMHTF